MEIVEIIKLGRELLKLLSENDVQLQDWKYVDMYEQYKRMRKHRVKYRTAVEELSSSYHISISKVERLIRRLRKVVK